MIDIIFILDTVTSTVQGTVEGTMSAAGSVVDYGKQLVTGTKGKLKLILEIQTYKADASLL